MLLRYKYGFKQSRTDCLTLISVLLLWQSLSACTPTVLEVAEPPAKTYVLDASIDPPAVIKRSSLVLQVTIPKAQPGYETRGIVYTRDPLTLDYFTKSEWADTPANMLAPLIVNAMESSGAFQAVMAAPAQSESDLRLDVDIIRLQHEFMSTPSRVQLALRAKLFDAKTRQVLATRLFETVEISSSEDAYGGVQAANIAVKKLLAEMVAFVVAAAGGFS